MRLGECEIQDLFLQRHQPGQRLFLADGADARLPMGEAVLHQGVHQGRLVGKMLVDRHGGDADPDGQAAHGKTVHAALVEQSAGGGEDAVAGGRFQHEVYSVYLMLDLSSKRKKRVYVGARIRPKKARARTSRTVETSITP